MNQEFRTGSFPMEGEDLHPTQKLGNIDAQYFPDYQQSPLVLKKRNVWVVNMYTQYHYGRDGEYLDYEALALCLRKLNIVFQGLYIGLPKIGCGLAGGDWDRVSEIIEKELKNCKVTIVEL